MLNFILFLLFTSLTYVPHSLAEISRLDQTQLKRIAEVEGKGYKCANLTMMRDELIAKFNAKKNDYAVAIPEFVGISSDKTQKFLKNYDIDVVARWGRLISEFLIPEREYVLREKQYPDIFLKKQKEFEEQLRIDFNNIISNKIDQKASLDALFGVVGLDKLSRDVAKKNERLMVRSSGKEDTKMLANAGGNESKSNVEVTTRDVLYALRDVVVSYFGQKSLKQRLGAGDESIFDPLPFTPVLLQRMIGEKSPHVVPKCGVMFTEEAEGGVARYAERDENNNVIGDLKTTGITIIQSAYGHNEGVVNSIIPVDTYYVDKSKTIYPVIRPKTHRMIPDLDAQRSLKLVKNDEEIIHKPALSSSAIQTLKSFAQTLEKFYNDTMDIEFVVDETEQKIYVVQARPIVHTSGLARPSYIARPDSMPLENVLNGQSIGVAGGSLRLVKGIVQNNAIRLVKRSDQIIVARNIGEALSIYQNKEQTPNVDLIECIVIGKNAPATSHEATAFRSEGKPVIYLEQWQKLDLWLKSPNTFVISPQQSLIIRWPGEINSVREMIKNELANEGWVNYPIPLLLSLSARFAKRPAQKFKDIIGSLLRKDDTVDSFLKRIDPPTDFREAITTLKQGSREEAERAIADILKTIRFQLKQAHGGHNGVLDESYRRRVALLFMYAIDVALNICPYLDAHPEDKAMYQARLFVIRILECILFQKPRLGEIEDGMISTERIIKGLSDEKGIRETKEITDPMTIKLMRFGNLALTDDLKNSWHDFIQKFMSTADVTAKNEFVQLVLSLGSLGVLPIWLHTSFDQINKNGISNSATIANKLIDEFKKDGVFIARIAQKLEIIKSFNIGVFESPKNFETSWQTFQYDILDYFLSDEFMTALKNASNLGKLIALGVMTKFVNDVFDLSIKAVTGSQQYKINDKLDKFHTMLKQYYKLFKTWMLLVPEGAIRYSPRSPLTSYFDIIDGILNRQKYTDEDRKASNFDVQSYTIGNGINIGGSAIARPKTLEDAFMIIHQCLLVTLNTLSAQAGIKEIVLPKKLLQIRESFMKIRSKEGKEPVLIGAEFVDDTINFFYNLPLRDHSIQFTLSYQRDVDLINLTTRFFGDNMFRRWDDLAYISLLLNALELCKINNLEVMQSGVSFTLQFDEGRCKQEIWEELQKMILYSYGEKDLYGFQDRVINAYQKHMDVLKSLSTASSFVNSTDTRLQSIGLYLFIALVQDNRGIEQAKNAASDAVFRSFDVKIQDAGLKLFKELVKKGQAFDDSISAASETFFKRNDMGGKEPLMDLFKALFDKAQGFDSAINIASKAVFEFSDFSIQNSGFDLFKELFEKGQGLDAAIRAANNAVFNTADENLYAGLSLFEVLVVQGYGSKEAIAAATHAVFKSNKPSVQYAGLKLIKALVEKNEAFDLAIKAGLDAVIKIDNHNIQAMGFDLLKILFHKGQGYSESITLASKITNQRTDSPLLSVGLKLFQELVENGQGYDAAALAANQAVLKSNNLTIQEVGLDLFNALFAKGQGFSVAITLASKITSKGTDPQVVILGLNLFKGLVESGQGYEAAIAAATEAVLQSSDFTTQDAGLDLFKALFEKGQGFVQARSVASEASQSADQDIISMGVQLIEAVGMYDNSDQ